MGRLLLAVVIAMAAVGVAAFIKRRRPDAPTQGSGHVPMQVDRRDFIGPELEWAILVFTSATCETCADAWQQASALAGETVAVQEVEVAEAPELHERYHIDAVPLVLVVDADGVSRRWFLGPTAPDGLAHAVDDLTH